MILRNGICHLVEKDRLPRPRRRHDDATLSFANGRHDVDHAHAEVAILHLEPKPFVGILRTKVVEWNAVFRLLRILGVDALDFEQREIAFPGLWWTHLPTHFISGPQSESFYLRGRDVDVVGTWEIAPVLAPQKSVSLGQNLEHPIAVEDDVSVEEVLLDLEDEILLPKTRRAVNLEAVCHLLKLAHGFSL